jgi:hypothetical protein
VPTRRRRAPNRAKRAAYFRSSRCRERVGEQNGWMPDCATSDRGGSAFGLAQAGREGIAAAQRIRREAGHGQNCPGPPARRPVRGSGRVENGVPAVPAQMQDDGRNSTSASCQTKKNATNPRPGHRQARGGEGVRSGRRRSWAPAGCGDARCRGCHSTSLSVRRAHVMFPATRPGALATTRRLC